MASYRRLDFFCVLVLRWHRGILPRSPKSVLNSWIYGLFLARHRQKSRYYYFFYWWKYQLLGIVHALSHFSLGPYVINCVIIWRKLEFAIKNEAPFTEHMFEMRVFFCCTRSVLLLKVSVCKFANFETPKIRQKPLRMLDLQRLHVYGRPAGRPTGRLPLQNPRFCRVDFSYFGTRNMHKNP